MFIDGVAGQAGYMAASARGLADYPRLARLGSPLSRVAAITRRYTTWRCPCTLREAGLAAAGPPPPRAWRWRAARRPDAPEAREALSRPVTGPPPRAPRR